MEIYLTGIAAILRFDVVLALLIGSIGGVVVGAIPGVGPAVAIAIVLPATFGLDPLVGLTLLLGIYGSAMYGGAIPAILINTPGTAVNALTTYDGHPMTKAGDGRRAISLAYSASFFGGVFSILCLVILAPQLAAVAPLFGSRDIFMAALLGAVLVIITHRGQTLLAGMLFCFGMFLNLIGFDAVTYQSRFAYGQPWLMQGIDLIVVLLGLFALSQAFTLLSEPDKSVGEAKVEGNLAGGLTEVLSHKRVATSSSAYGVVMGIIPGVGEFLAQFFAYATARRLSKTPERFGKGAPEGIIAAESANNAVPAAAMIPLLAIGVPGEALTAMMMSVFTVHNIIPGPQLFETRPDFLISLYGCLLVSNVIVLICLLFSTNAIIRTIRTPTRLIGMAVLTLSFVGVYSLRNSIVDCAIAACFGVLGYVMKRVGWPVVPIILGMVLGRIMDEKFRSSLARVNTPFDMIDRPIAGTIFGLIVVLLAIHIWSLRPRRKTVG